VRTRHRQLADARVLADPGLALAELLGGFGVADLLDELCDAGGGFGKRQVCALQVFEDLQDADVLADKVCASCPSGFASTSTTGRLSRPTSRPITCSA
jgi:hypothetical protein